MSSTVAKRPFSGHSSIGRPYTSATKMPRHTTSGTARHSPEGRLRGFVKTPNNLATIHFSSAIAKVYCDADWARAFGSRRWRGTPVVSCLLVRQRDICTLHKRDFTTWQRHRRSFPLASDLTICYHAFSAERWPSGRRRPPAKRLQGLYLCRGFESRPLRHAHSDAGAGLRDQDFGIGAGGDSLLSAP